MYCTKQCAEHAPSSAQSMPGAMHATNATYATNVRIQDSSGNRLVPDAPTPVDNSEFVREQLSSEMAFTDFLRVCELRKVRVALERYPLPSSHRRAQSYQADTDAIVDALRVGSRGRLEAVMFGLVMGS